MKNIEKIGIKMYIISMLLPNSFVRKKENADILVNYYSHSLVYLHFLFLHICKYCKYMCVCV